MCIEQKNLMIIIAVALVGIIAYMLLKNKQENFQPQNIVIPIRQEEAKQVESEIRNAPKISTEVGSIVDGPGYESSQVDGVDQAIMSKVPSDYYFLDDGANGKYSITSNLFSKSCCSSQWPVPFKMAYDPYVCKNKEEYVGSNIMGNNTFQNSGCACITKDQAKFLYTRGNNGSEWF